MSGFSNSLSHFLRHPCHPNPIFQFIHSATSHLTICLIIRSISIRVSDLQYLQFCNKLWWTDCRKSLPNLSTHLPLRRYPPSNLQWTQIRDFQTRTRTRNPGLTFPKPENQDLQKEPGFGNSSNGIATPTTGSLIFLNNRWNHSVNKCKSQFLASCICLLSK